MRRILTLAVLTVVVAPVAAVTLPAALAGASGTRAKLQLRYTGRKFGAILVNGRGFTVYAFTLDRRNKDVCQINPTCLAVWPPVKTSGKAIAGRGVRPRLIGTIRLRNGTRQVTYAGHPLYTYIVDASPAETAHIDIRLNGGRWPAINAAGHEVK